MDCERLQTLIKSWYVQVQDEALAPARMVSFMEKHIEECATCLADPVVKSEVDRITTIVLPPSKIPKAVKDKEAKEKAEEVETKKDEETTEGEEVETKEDEETTEGEEADSDGGEDEDENGDDEDEVDPDKLEQLTSEEDDDV